MNKESRFFKTKQYGFYRDKNNFSLINTDTEGYRMYKLLRDEKLKVRKLTEDVQNVQSQLDNLSNLIKDLANKG